MTHPALILSVAVLVSESLIHTFTTSDAERLVLMIGAVGIGIAYVIDRVGRSWIRYRKDFDAAFESSFAAKLEEATRERQELIVKIDEAARSRDELLAEVKLLRVERDAEKRARDEAQERMYGLALRFLQDHNYVKPETAVAVAAVAAKATPP